VSAPDTGPVLWFTGLPASGKTTTALAVIRELRGAGRTVLHLDSDDLRAFFPGYDAEGRDRFYAALAHLARLGAIGGAIVIVSATANLRRYRDAARALAPGPFIEILVTCPPEVVARRDPKGLYAAARTDPHATLPGAGAVYEPPLAPECIIHGDGELSANVAAVLARAGVAGG
jgi:adenylylsulfate kinase